MGKRKEVEEPIINRHEIRTLMRLDDGSEIVIKTTLAELQLLQKEVRDQAIAQTQDTVNNHLEKERMATSIREILNSPMPPNVLLSAAVPGERGGVLQLTIHLGALRQMLEKLLPHLES